MPDSGNNVVDAAAHDGGLRKCLAEAGLHPDVVAAVIHSGRGVGCEDPSDFVNCAASASYETDMQVVFFDKIVLGKQCT